MQQSIDILQNGDGKHVIKPIIVNMCYTCNKA